MSAPMHSTPRRTYAIPAHAGAANETCHHHPPSSIIADPHNPTLYTNRALARLKLSLWDSVVADCESCLLISPGNAKALYQLSQAQLALRNYDAALNTAQRARERHAATGDGSLSIVTAHVLRCRKERWDDRERRRTRQEAALEGEVLEMLARARQEAESVAEDDAVRRDVGEEWTQKESAVRAVFERARSNAERKREVPDWAIDDISFGIMVDPVVVSLAKKKKQVPVQSLLLTAGGQDKIRQIVRTRLHHRTPPPAPGRSHHARAAHGRRALPEPRSQERLRDVS